MSVDFRKIQLFPILAILLLGSCHSEQDAKSPKLLETPTILNGFDLPETVVFDETSDTYFVSNMAGHPTQKNGNGFISTINAVSLDIDYKAIVGTSQCPLHAPKGLFIDEGILYVVDIDSVCSFNLRTNEWILRQKIEDAVALNDGAINQNGVICLSDPKLIFDDQMQSERVGTPQLILFDTTSRTSLTIDYPTNEQPNGVELDGDSYLIAPLVGGNVMHLNSKTRKLTKWSVAPKKLDGIERINDGSVLVSSLDRGCIFLLQKHDGVDRDPIEIISNLNLPGNFCLDQKHERLIIPLIGEGNVILSRFSHPNAR